MPVRMCCMRRKRKKAIRRALKHYFLLYRRGSVISGYSFEQDFIELNDSRAHVSATSGQLQGLRVAAERDCSRGQPKRIRQRKRKYKERKKTAKEGQKMLRSTRARAPISWENNFDKQAVRFPTAHCAAPSQEEIMPQKPALYAFNLLFRGRDGRRGRKGRAARRIRGRSLAESRRLKLELVQTISPFYNVTTARRCPTVREGGGGRSFIAGFFLSSFTTTCANIKLFDLLVPHLTSNHRLYLRHSWYLLPLHSSPGQCLLLHIIAE